MIRHAANDQARCIQVFESPCTDIFHDNLATACRLSTIERNCAASIRHTCLKFNGRRPEILAIVHEVNRKLAMVAAKSKSSSSGGGSGNGNGAQKAAGGSRAAALSRARKTRKLASRHAKLPGQKEASDDESASDVESSVGGSSSGGDTGVPAPPSAVKVPQEVLDARRAANPRERPGSASDVEDLTYG